MTKDTPKAPPPDTITLGVRISVYELLVVGDMDIQSTAEAFLTLFSPALEAFSGSSRGTITWLGAPRGMDCMGLC